jgi:signal peptidase I
LENNIQETQEAAQEKEKKPEKVMTASENLREWIKDILFAVVFAVLFLQFFQPTIVKEHSMENTFHENDYLFVSKRSYTWLGGAPKYGDIIVFQSNLAMGTSGKNKQLIKRVIAVPGDYISIRDGVVYLNGQALDEPYTRDGYTDSYMEEVTIPEGYIFAMGDNRQNSADSRDSRIGLVPIESIKGKAVLRLYPFNQIGGVYKNFNGGK